MGRIKILEIVRDADGGMKKHVETMLCGLDKDKFDVLLICSKGQFDWHDLKNKIKNLYEISLGDRRSPWAQCRSIINLIRIIKKEKIDIIHCHGFMCCIMGTAAGILCGKPLIITTIHNFPDIKDKCAKQRLSNLLSGFFLRFNRHIIVVSMDLMDFISKLWNIPQDKMQVIYNGIDVRQLRDVVNNSPYNPYEFPDAPMSGRIFAEIGEIDTPNDISGKCKQVIILNIARLIPSKGVDVFLRAAAVFMEKLNCNPPQPAVRPLFVIAGDGPQKSELKKIAHELGMERYVKFLGFRKDIYKLIYHSYMVVLSSHSEGLGLAVLEALALEKPVIASRVGGIPEIVIHRKTGLLVPPDNPEALADAFMYYIKNPDVAKKLAADGCQMVSGKFSTSAMLENLENLFLDLYAGTVANMPAKYHTIE